MVHLALGGIENDLGEWGKGLLSRWPQADHLGQVLSQLGFQGNLLAHRAGSHSPPDRTAGSGHGGWGRPPGIQCAQVAFSIEPYPAKGDTQTTERQESPVIGCGCPWDIPKLHFERWKEMDASVSYPRAGGHPVRPLRPGPAWQHRGRASGVWPRAALPSSGPYLVQLTSDIPQEGDCLSICLEGRNSTDGVFELQQRPCLHRLAACNGAGRVFITTGV